MLSPLKVSSDYLLSLVRKWEIYVSNCGRRISRPEVNFTKLFHVTLELICVYNIYKFQVNHLKNKRDLGHRKSRKWKVFYDYRKLKNLFPVGLIFSDATKRDLINWYKFHAKIKILKISISTITSCDDRNDGHRVTPKTSCAFKIYPLWKRLTVTNIMSTQPRNTS